VVLSKEDLEFGLSSWLALVERTEPVDDEILISLTVRLRGGCIVAPAEKTLADNHLAAVISFENHVLGVAELRIAESYPMKQDADSVQGIYAV
jgi:hypothetical protein